MQGWWDVQGDRIVEFIGILVPTRWRNRAEPAAENSGLIQYLATRPPAC